MSYDHFRRPSPKHRVGPAAPSTSHDRAAHHHHTAAATDSEAAQRAEYTRAVLAQYRKHVATNIEPELERLKNENAELRYDADIASEQVLHLQQKLRHAEEEAAELKKQLRHSRDDVELQLRRAAEHAQDRLNAAQRVSKVEMEQLRSELTRTKEALDQLKAEGYDPQVNRKLARAQDELVEAKAAKEAALGKCAALQRELDEVEKRHIGATLTLKSVSDAALELQGLIREAADFGGGVCTAFGLMDCECPEASTAAAQWRSLAASCAATKGHESASDNFSRLRADIEEVTNLAAGCRRTLAQDHQGLAAALKRMIVRHTEVLESAAAAEHQRQQEKELARRRLAELEEDRKAEREGMLTALEKERVKSRLMSVSAAPQSPTGNTTGAHGSRKPPALAHVAAQTGPELMDMRSEQQHTARLMTEVVSLQNQLGHHRETIHLLEQQRRLFMDFVEDPEVTSHVFKALQGDEGFISSEEFLTYGV